LHYRDKEELLLESIDTIADELTEKIYHEINQQGLDVNSTTRFRPIVFVFQHATENRMLYQIILRGEGSTIAASRIRKIIFDAALMFFNVQLDPGIKGILNRPQLELVAAYFSSSLLGFLTWWLETESKYTPEEMGDYYRRFFFDGMRSFIQMPTELENRIS
jgi:AcrR family transcriptional regulator